MYEELVAFAALHGVQVSLLGEPGSTETMVSHFIATSAAIICQPCPLSTRKGIV